jgi:hypothetical protein
MQEIANRLRTQNSDQMAQLILYVSRRYHSMGDLFV